MYRVCSFGQHQSQSFQRKVSAHCSSLIVSSQSTFRKFRNSEIYSNRFLSKVKKVKRAKYARVIHHSQSFDSLKLKGSPLFQLPSLFPLKRF